MTTQYLTGYYNGVPLTLKVGSKIDVNELIKVWESEIDDALKMETREEYIEDQYELLEATRKAWDKRDTIEEYDFLPADWCKGIAILLKLGVTNDDEVEIGLSVEQSICPRCIEDYENDNSEVVKGEKKVSHCECCKVCVDCECLDDCEKK